MKPGKIKIIVVLATALLVRGVNRRMHAGHRQQFRLCRKQPTGFAPQAQEPAPLRVTAGHRVAVMLPTPVTEAGSTSGQGFLTNDTLLSAAATHWVCLNRTSKMR